MINRISLNVTTNVLRSYPEFRFSFRIKDKNFGFGGLPTDCSYLQHTIDLHVISSHMFYHQRVYSRAVHQILWFPFVGVRFEEPKVILFFIRRDVCSVWIHREDENTDRYISLFIRYAALKRCANKVYNLYSPRWVWLFSL